MTKTTNSQALTASATFTYKLTTMNDTTVISMRVSPEIKRAIEILAEAEKRSKNNMIRLLLEEALNARARKLRSPS